MSSSLPDCSAAGSGQSLVQRVSLFGWLLTMVMAGVGWFVYGWHFAQSLLVGGLLANSSFWLLQRDARRLMRRMDTGPDQSAAVAGVEKIRFLLHFFARLLILGLILLVLAAQISIDVFGLCLGLGTVVLSVVLIGLGQKKCWLPNKV